MNNHIFTEVRKDFTEMAGRMLTAQTDLLFPSERKAMEQMGIKDKSLQLLDIGCGNGYYLTKLAKAFPGFHCTGIDSNESLIRDAEKAVADSGLKNITLKHCSVFDLEEEAAYDLVFSHAALQYLHLRIDEYFSQVRGFLRPRGTFLCFEPEDAFALIYPENALLSKMMQTIGSLVADRGGDRFVGRKLPHYLEKHGFTEVSFKPLLVNNYDTGKEKMLRMIEIWLEFLNVSDSALITESDLVESKQVIAGLRDEPGFVFVLPWVGVKAVKP